MEAAAAAATTTAMVVKKPEKIVLGGINFTRLPEVPMRVPYWISELDGDNEPTELRGDAVVAYVDVDSFEVQIYLSKLHGPKWTEIYRSLPVVVVDPIVLRIVSSNQLAKDAGIGRMMREEDALRLCPNLMVFRKEIKFQKGENFNLRRYHYIVLSSLKFAAEEATKKLNMEKPIALECNSNDGFYLDFSDAVDKTIETCGFLRPTGERIWVEEEDGKLTYKQWEEKYGNGGGISKEMLRLVIGSNIAESFKRHVARELGFSVSIGLGKNKVVSKLASHLNRPGGITILPFDAVKRATTLLPLRKLPLMEGPVGEILLEEFASGGNMTVRDLAKLSWSQLVLRCPDPKVWFYRMMYFRNLARGYSTEIVVTQLMKPSLLVSRKTFRDLLFPTQVENIVAALKLLNQELVELLTDELNLRHRLPAYIVIHVEYILFPRRPEDRGKPSSIWEVAIESPAWQLMLLKGFNMEALQYFIDQFVKEMGTRGVVTRLAIVVPKFRSWNE